MSDFEDDAELLRLRQKRKSKRAKRRLMWLAGAGVLAVTVFVVVAGVVLLNHSDLFSTLPEDVDSAVQRHVALPYEVLKVNKLSIRGVRGPVLGEVLEDDHQKQRGRTTAREPVHIDGVYAVDVVTRYGGTSSRKRVIVFRKKGGGTDLVYDAPWGQDWSEAAKTLVR